jgi:hypothetical protein
MTDAPKIAAYYIADLRPDWQDAKRHPYITFWRPDNAGYCYSLPWAGRYDKTMVDSRPGYYTKLVKAGEKYYCGENPYPRDTWMRFPVPCDVVERLAVAEPRPGRIDGDVGPVVPNTAAARKALRAAAYTREPVTLG